jgi:uncharacterized protein (UPF0335 family)
MTDATTTVTVDSTELKSFVQRIHRMMDEIDSLGEDLKEIYIEAKSRGFDTKILRRVAAALRDKEAFEEQQAIFDLYMESADV